MYLTYRGRRYQKTIVPATVSKISYPCVYRQVPYQASSNFSYKEGEPTTVQLTYRGATYTRML